MYKDWLNTGDIGYFDENQELHIIERVDDVIVFEAHKIYPREIEKQILDCGFGEECIVTKIEYKDSDFIACLYTGINKSEQELRTKLKERLPVYEIPRRFIWCDGIPRTLNGKIAKAKVKTKILSSIETE